MIYCLFRRSRAKQFCLANFSKRVDPQTLRLTNVTFGYETRPGEKALHNISLTVPAKSMVAIVGPSGAGKVLSSTLYKDFMSQNAVESFGENGI